MSILTTLHCHYLIMDLFSNANRASFTDIKQRLEGEGFILSDRTIQRYIEHFRVEYKIEIEYKRAENVYEVPPEYQSRFEEFRRMLLKLHEGASISKQLEIDSVQYIQTDNNESYSGIKWFNLLLNAIKRHKQIKITYKKFGQLQSKNYILEPYLLKEYAQRWYIYAWDTQDECFKTFGLERIEQINTLATKFKRNTRINPKEEFDSIIGINLPNTKPSEVVLKVKNSNVDYLLTVSLHASQKEIKRTITHSWFSLNLCINFELKQKILTHAGYVEVVSPASLRKEILNIAQQLAKAHS